jgi:peptide/nickel transport system substrate-binding protein
MFFRPLSRRALGAVRPQDLLTDEAANRHPLGWGPYQVDEWIPGDHISLSRNPNYFRAGEGLPRFGRLVFRFVQPGKPAVDALQAGECDFLDETALAEGDLAELTGLQKEGKLKLVSGVGSAWEGLVFNTAAPVPIPSVDGKKPPASAPPVFARKEVRQAVIQCLDRQALAARFSPAPVVPDSYAPPGFPLTAADVTHWELNPQMAARLLDAAGWVDAGGRRVAKGIAGLTDGTPLAFSLLSAEDPNQAAVAQAAAEWLRTCGLQVEVKRLPWDQLTASGPDGVVFGRKFDLAGFAWSAAVEPACFIYTSSEIPGPYPDQPKGWGGANAGGYSNPEFDLACAQALNTPWDSPEHVAAHAQAQRIFAQDLPAVPLFLHARLAAARPDFCPFEFDAWSTSALAGLESFDYGKECR